MHVGEHPYKRTAHAPLISLFLLAAFFFSPLFSRNPPLLEPPRLHRDLSDWTLLDIAGSVVVVTDLPCTPFLACSGCLILLLSFFLSPYFFSPLVLPLLHPCPTSGSQFAKIKFTRLHGI